MARDDDKADAKVTGVQVVVKAAAILDELARRKEAGAAEIADAIAEPRSSVYRLLNTLTKLELVEPAPTRGMYQLGFKLLELGAAVSARFDERSAALPVMERLHEATGETVFLCVRHSDVAVCIERIEGRWVQSMALQIGGTLPMHIGAAPRALLAFSGRDAWASYLARWDRSALTPNTPVTDKALIGELERTLELGCAVSDEDVVIGMAAVGAPIFGHTGELRAAISMSGPRPTILGDAEERSRELIVEAAHDISYALGNRDESPAAEARKRNGAPSRRPTRVGAAKQKTRR